MRVSWVTACCVAAVGAGKAQVLGAVEAQRREAEIPMHDPGRPLLRVEEVHRETQSEMLMPVTARPPFLPLLANANKTEALHKFWSKSGPIVYWHIQKTGGTTMCRSAVAEGMYTYKFWKHVPDKKQKARVLSEIYRLNCRVGLPYKTLCDLQKVQPDPYYTPMRPWNFTGVMKSWEPEIQTGRLFFAMEPSVCTTPCIAYDFPQAWFAQEFFVNPSSPFWDRYLHVLTVRDPAERVLSDFRQRDFDTRWCPAIGLEERECMAKMVLQGARGLAELEEAWNRKGFSGESLVKVVREHFLSNHIIVHLSGTYDDIELTKENLRRMSLIVDLRARPVESDYLLQGLYSVFRNELNVDKHKGRFHEGPPFSELYPELYVGFRKALAMDFEVWDYALSLIDLHVDQVGYQPVAGKN